MKYKYRKLIIICSLVMMFVGMVVMSVGHSSDKEKANLDDQMERARTELIEKDGVVEVNNLIKNYLDAQVECNLDVLSLYVNDIRTYSKSELKKKMSYVEDFKNVSCYSIKALEEDSYVVYVYREYKLENIDTLIPSIVLNYVCKNDAGELVVYNGDISKDTNEFIKQTELNPTVLDLVDVVNNRIAQIKEEDNEVRHLLEQLDSVADK